MTRSPDRAPARAGRRGAGGCAALRRPRRRRTRGRPCLCDARQPARRAAAGGGRRGLAEMHYLDEPLEPFLEALARRRSPRIVASAGALDPWRRELDEYFAGTRRRFEAPLDWEEMPPFQRAVLSATAAIPYGETSTYTGVAAAAGSPRAQRAAGNALGREPAGDHHSLPPRAATWWRLRRLHRRPGAQALPARAGGAQPRMSAAIACACSPRFGQQAGDRPVAVGRAARWDSFHAPSICSMTARRRRSQRPSEFGSRPAGRRAARGARARPRTARRAAPASPRPRRGRPTAAACRSPAPLRSSRSGR